MLQGYNTIRNNLVRSLNIFFYLNISLYYLDSRPFFTSRNNKIIERTQSKQVQKNK